MQRQPPWLFDPSKPISLLGSTDNNVYANHSFVFLFINTNNNSSSFCSILLWYVWLSRCSTHCLSRKEFLRACQKWKKFSVFSSFFSTLCIEWKAVILRPTLRPCSPYAPPRYHLQKTPILVTHIRRWYVAKTFIISRFRTPVSPVLGKSLELFGAKSGVR